MQRNLLYKLQQQTAQLPVTEPNSVLGCPLGKVFINNTDYWYMIS